MKAFARAAAAVFVCCISAFAIPGPALAGSSDAAILKPIHQFTDGFNAGSANTALQAVSPDGSVVIDEFAPHVWQGKTAIADWMNEWDMDAQDRGITGAKVTLGDPLRVQSDGKTAYVVLPVTYDYMEKGVAMHEDATMTCTLSKASGTWLINGWSWNGQVPVKAAP